MCHSAGLGWVCSSPFFLVFYCVLLGLAQITLPWLTGPGEFNLLSKGVLWWLFPLLFQIISPALWPVFFFNAQIPRLYVHARSSTATHYMALLVSGDLIHCLHFTAALATACIPVPFHYFLLGQLCRCGLSTARQKPCTKAEADFG